jgi:hypothetical protein
MGQGSGRTPDGIGGRLFDGRMGDGPGTSPCGGTTASPGGLVDRRGRQAMSGFCSSRLVALSGGLALLLASCQAMQKEEAKSTEQLLAAAGFQIRQADTPARMTHLETLTQRKLVPHDQDGQMRYVYADALDCKCLYVGDEAEYDAYQKLAAQQRIADEEEEAATMNMDAGMDWGLWGPW